MTDVPGWGRMAAMSTVTCTHCRRQVTLPHQCPSAQRTITEDDSGSFLLSAVVGYATDSAVLGGLVGGDMLGGIVGDMMDGDLFD